MQHKAVRIIGAILVLIVVGLLYLKYQADQANNTGTTDNSGQTQQQPADQGQQQ